MDPPSSKKSRALTNYGKGNNGTHGSGSSKQEGSGNVKVLFEPMQLGGVSNLDELEVKTLKFQNQKLGLRLTQRLAIEEELKQRIDQLEKRQTQDDAVINVIHRYWNQLNEDMRILLQRFDAETGDEEEKNEESDSTTSFLTQLATWHKQELDEKLASRVQVSQRAVGKIIQVFDHVIQRNERLSKLIQGKDQTPNGDVTSITEKSPKSDPESTEKKTDSKSSDDLTKKSKAEVDKSDTPETEKAGSSSKKSSDSSDKKGNKSKQSSPLNSLDDQVKDWNEKLVKENKNLHRLNTSLHEKNRFLSLKQAEFEELINAEQTKSEELQNKLDDLEYELTKSRMRNGKLENVLVDTQDKLRMFMTKDGGSLEPKLVLTNSERKTVDQMSQDLEENRELAINRLVELEKTNASFKDALKEVERLKMELSTLPEHVVVETTEHKCLQSQFSVLYNEAMQLKTQLEDARSQLQMVKNAHMRQIEQMESEELMTQKKLRTEVIQLEDMLAQVRKEYEMLRIEFEQNLAANEQTGPINKEMRNLIQSLQTHNVQLKGEVARYKRKGKEANLEIVKLRKDLEDMKTAEIKALQAKGEMMMKANAEADGLRVANNINANLDTNSQDSSSSPTSEAAAGSAAGLLHHNHQTGQDNLGNIKNSGNGSDNITAENETDNATADESSNGPIKVKSEPDGEGVESGGSDAPIKDEPMNQDGGNPLLDGIKSDQKSSSTPTTPVINTPIKKEMIKVEQPQELKAKIEELQRQRAKDNEVMKDLRKQLKDAQKDVREMKLLLDMFKTLPKEQRDKAQLMAAEKEVKAELDDSRNELKRVREAKKEEKKRLADEDAQRRIRQLEETCSTLQKQVANHKQEEEALLSEMEVTGQAFEDMQEQNSGLIQQLREKDDANFKLMSERIKSNQIQRLAREERDMLTQQVNTLSTQVEAQNQVVRKLEEKERLLQTNLAALDKELSMRQQAMEMHKRKAIESAQSAADLKLHLEKYHAQIKEMQITVAEKTSSLEAEAFKTKRLQEELVLVKRKVERLRKIEMASDMDEILKEEIREYKETLTCPSCKVKRKDAVLTKCFHCFCYDCLRTRYETRQRKCPKCNAAFGASDYHRLYLA